MYGHDQFCHGGVLCNKTMSASLESTTRISLILMHRQNDDFNLRIVFSQLAYSFNASHPRHRYVCDNDIGL